MSRQTQEMKMLFAHNCVTVEEAPLLHSSEECKTPQ